MVKEDRRTWKAKYFARIVKLLDEYPRCFIVGADNVGSKQMQMIRISMRGHAVVLMGKNTMMRKAIRGHLENNPNLEKLLPHIVENIGFVFTKEDLSTIRDKIVSNKVAAPAKANAFAPCDVMLPAQVTSLGPEKTSFFQALQITTKITKGNIEIINDINLIGTGDKVGASEATLLNMLNISPFSYGLTVKKVYDSGACFDPSILNIKPDDIKMMLCKSVRDIAAISLSIGYPTIASVPHSIANGFKKVLAISVATDIDFEESKKVKEYLKDPSKFAVAAAPVAEVKETKKAKTPEPEEDDEDADMGFGLFD